MNRDLRKGDIELQHWNIVVFEAGGEVYEKILGYEAVGDSFHISSKLIEYDHTNGLARTETHSFYKLIGRPGVLHPKAQVIFDKLNAHKELKVSLKY